MHEDEGDPKSRHSPTEWMHEEDNGGMSMRVTPSPDTLPPKHIVPDETTTRQDTLSQNGV